MAHLARAATFLQDSGTASSSRTFNYGKSVAAGQFLALAVNSHGGTAGSVFTATDTKGNVWTQRAINDTSVTNNRVAILTCTVSTAVTTADTITLTISSGTRATWCVVVEEFDPVVGFDAAANANGSATSAISAGSAASTHASELIVAALGWSGLFTISTMAGGYTAEPTITATTATRNVTLAWKYETTAGTRAPSGTLSGSTASAGAMAVMEVAPAVVARPWQIKTAAGTWAPADVVIM